jgi:hypothetical protein
MDVDWLDLNANAAGACANASQEWHVAQPGSKVDQYILLRKKSSIEQIEDMASRRRLVNHHFRRWLHNHCPGLFELEYSSNEFVQIVVSFAFVETDGVPTAD